MQTTCGPVARTRATASWQAWRRSSSSPAAPAAISGTISGGCGSTAAARSGTESTVSGRRNPAHGTRQDTVWSRSAPGARLGGGPTCENAGSNTHCALAGTPGTPGWLRRREDGLHMTSDWTTFGRVDEEGTVYVKTAAGERVVGSWQAGTPEEGLAHFARRFADIVTEVDLIEARLASGAADATHSLASIRRLRSGLDTAHAVGDLDG